MKAYNVLVIGSFPDSTDCRKLDCSELAGLLGRRMMLETPFTLLSGGLGKREPKKPDAVDKFVLIGASEALKKSGTSPKLRIITMLPDEKKDRLAECRLKIGRVVNVPSSNIRTRRYKMVLNSDAVVAFGGGNATRQMLELSYMAGKPLLPLMTTGGRAEKVWEWENFESEFVERFAASREDVQIIQTSRDPSAIVNVCLKLLKNVLKSCCFVAMPFSDHPFSNAFQTIRDTVKEMGYRVLRVDQETDLYQEDIVDSIWEAIRGSDVVIADLSDHRPNVYYELGISHALGKPTCLILYDRGGEVPDDIPFDISVKRILSYTSEDHLRQQLISLFTDLDAKKCQTPGY